MKVYILQIKLKGKCHRKEEKEKVSRNKLNVDSLRGKKDDLLRYLFI